MMNRLNRANRRHERSTSNAVMSASPLTVKLKRGTGTRDQDEVIAKAKGKTLEDAREDMEVLREYIHDLAEDARQIQPEEEDG